MSVKRALVRAAPTELMVLVLLSLMVVALMLLDEDDTILLELNDEKMPLLPPATAPPRASPARRTRGMRPILPRIRVLR